jgi:hypothetical protein
MNAKKFDAVQMTREIRDKMAEEFNKDPEAERRELERIRKKYGLPPQPAQSAAKVGDTSNPVS